MVQETRLHKEQLIYPLFLVDGKGIKSEVSSLPNNFRWSLDLLLKEIEECMNLGIKNFVLFPGVEESLKDSKASYAMDKDMFYYKAIREIKKRFPECSLMSDVAMDPYSSNGHDGFFENGKILNDETLDILAEMSLLQAEAGIDILGPSDMMDGRVGFIREELDDNGFTDTSIMSYSAKYASCFYGPFRDALDSAPKDGDKKTYQMNPANKYEALVEARLDEEEGADFLMIKPALSYLDIIHIVKNETDLPVSAYNVSGECAMLEAAAEKGWLDREAAIDEMLGSIHRAGADIILTYFAKDFAKRH
jgi:porphobilinogen synthase